MVWKCVGARVCACVLVCLWHPQPPRGRLPPHGGLRRLYGLGFGRFVCGGETGKDQRPTTPRQMPSNLERDRPFRRLIAVTGWRILSSAQALPQSLPRYAPPSANHRPAMCPTRSHKLHRCGNAVPYDDVVLCASVDAVCASVFVALAVLFELIASGVSKPHF